MTQPWHLYLAFVVMLGKQVTGTYNFAKSPFKAAKAPLATATRIQGVVAED